MEGGGCRSEGRRDAREPACDDGRQYSHGQTTRATRAQRRGARLRPPGASQKGFYREFTDRLGRMGAPGEVVVANMRRYSAPQIAVTSPSCASLDSFSSSACSHPARQKSRPRKRPTPHLRRLPSSNAASAAPSRLAKRGASTEAPPRPAFGLERHTPKTSCATVRTQTMSLPCASWALRVTGTARLPVKRSGSSRCPRKQLPNRPPPRRGHLLHLPEHFQSHRLGSVSVHR